jgi:outer membrane receptor protein involved in Fe transport
MTKKIQKNVIMSLRIMLLFLIASVWMLGLQAQTAPTQSAPGQAPGQKPTAGQSYGQPGQAPGQKPGPSGGQSYGQPGQAPGQAYGQKPAQAAPQGNGLVKGMIRDSTTSGGIEYATVGLYRQSDSTLVNGIVTNSNGEFVLKGIPNGQFYLDVNFIGYIKKRIHNITVAPQSTTVDMGPIALHANVTQIGDVQVVAQSNRVEYKIDKKVVNVSSDIAASGGTLVNVLESTPSVQVDVEGNVTLRGSGNFQLLIDGKPSVIQGSEGLQQIPASAVQNLEIITSPSAKYDPDGNAGIINVIMKKQKNLGIGGVINASVGTRNKYTTDFLINFRQKKVNFFVGAEYANQKNYMEGVGERRTYYRDSLTNDILSTTYQKTNTDGIFTRRSLNLKGGFDYTLSETSTLSLTAAANDRSFERNFTSKNHWYNDPFVKDSFYLDNSTGTDKSRFYNVNLDYKKNYDDKGHSLQASLYYTTGKSDETEEETVTQTDADYVATGSEPVRTRSRTSQPEYNVRAELDYIRPIGANKLEAGLQSRWDKDKSDYIFEDYQVEGNEWIYNDTISNSLDYLDAIQSAYAMFNGPLGKFEYQLGLRAEYDNRNLKQLTSNESYRYEKFHFFPSFYVTRKLSEAHKVQFTYSRRIQRPDERDLNPFKEYRGSNNVFYGNPALTPEFTNSFELNYQYTFKKGFMSLETYYRGTTDKITRISGVDTLDGKQVFINTSTNADADMSVGVELMANLDLTKWWQLNVTGDFYHYSLQGRIEGNDVTSQSNTWRTNFNSTFKIKADTRLQIMAIYNGPSVTLQGKRDGFFVTNVALRQDFMKKKLTVTLSARDVFATGKFSFNSEGSNFYTYNKFQREAPVILLNFTYRINNYKAAARRGNGDQEGGEGGGMDMGM